MKTEVNVFVCLPVMLLCLFYGYRSNGQTNDSLGRPDGIQVPLVAPSQLTPGLNDSKGISPSADRDSILKWKQGRGFAYMRYLDSLLRKQKDLRADTVSIDQNTGTIHRRKQHEQHPSMANRILNSLPLKMFFWLLAIIFIGYISYHVFVKNGIFIRGKHPATTVKEEKLRELDDISVYDRQISEAENSNDLNLASRYLFLKTLRMLSDKGFIDFTPEKTNKEYMKEMEHSHFSLEFQRLTRSYEYIWYGKFSIQQNNYARLKEQFNVFHKDL